eukprot:scaffold215703_cov40-Prasinocladus_malaysianus.AAC.1
MSQDAAYSTANTKQHAGAALARAAVGRRSFGGREGRHDVTGPREHDIPHASNTCGRLGVDIPNQRANQGLQAESSANVV